MNRDKALLILNDHCGVEVDVSVKVAQGDCSTSPVIQRGVLQHWHSAIPTVTWPAGWSPTAARDGLTGMYWVGSVGVIDVTDLTEAWLLHDLNTDDPPVGIAFELAADRISLEVVWGGERTGPAPDDLTSEDEVQEL